MSFLSPYETEVVRLSLLVSAVAVLGSLPLGLACGWLLARVAFKGKIILDCFVHLPLVLPPVVVGYGLLVTLGHNGLMGHWLEQWFGVSFAFNWKGAAVASAVIAFPLLVRSIRLSIEAVDPGLEQAARTLGCGPAATFLRVTLPLSMPGVIAGMVLAFARSLSEFGATITFVSNIPGETRTLPLALYAMTQTASGDGEALRLCAISIALAVVALIASDLLHRRMTSRA